MYEALKLIFVFILIVLGLRRKIFVGYILFGASLLTAILYGLNYKVILTGYFETFYSGSFIYLLLIIMIITFLGRILREIGYLDRLAKAGEKLIGGSKTAAASLPALVGLMPMPGGALLSAPLIGQILRKEKYKPEFRTVVNYWSRHVVEFIWPIYPGLVLASELTGLPIGVISLLNSPMPLIMLPIGYIFMIRKIENSSKGQGQFIRPALQILALFWPILLGILISLIFTLKLLFAFAIALIILLIKERPDFKKIKTAASEAFTLRLVFLVFGVLSFQKMLEITGAIGSFTTFSSSLGLPDAVIIILVSFSAGLLTGILFALVGLAYPLLAGFLYQPDINLGNIFLAFISGYVGMIFSPTHFCLILTNEHFKSNLGRVYRLLTIPLILLFLAGLILYLTGYPWISW